MDWWWTCCLADWSLTLNQQLIVQLIDPNNISQRFIYGTVEVTDAGISALGAGYVKLQITNQIVLYIPSGDERR